MPDHPLLQDILVRGSAWFSFFVYVFTLIGWTRRWPVPQLRWLWTAGCAVFLIHVALAFHLVHAWSHQAAWDATEIQGGYGEGIYLNYLVIAVWSMDVLWWWLWPGNYLQRSRYFSYPIHAFLLFMWLNAAVFFAQWPDLLLGVLLFFWLGYSAWWGLKHR